MKKFVLTVLMLMTLSSLVFAKDRFYSDPALADLNFPQIMTYYYPTDTPSEYGLIPRVELFSDPRAGQAAEKSLLPYSYDMREEGFMPPIRSQSPWGTCWAHAMLGTVEASAMMKYGDFVSLSPLHLAWYGKQTDTIIINPLRTGGSWNTNYFKSLNGPVAEADCPYKEPWVVPDRKFDIPGYVTAVRNVSIPGLKITYEPKDDSKEEEEQEPDYDKYSIDVSSVKDRVNAIKNYVSKYGAVWIDYCSSRGTKDNTIFVDSPLDYEKGEYRNHAVCIVGWNDLYSIDGSKFNSVPLSHWEEIPDPDGKNIVGGAFLIRNSWGMNSEGGYYWMSYLDRSLTTLGYGCEWTKMSEINYDKAISVSSVVSATEDGQYIRSAKYALARKDMSEDGVVYAIRYTRGSITQNEIYVKNLTTGQSASVTIVNDGYSGYQTSDLSEPLEYSAGDKIEFRVDNDANNDGDSYIAVGLPENTPVATNSYLSNDGENWYPVNASISAELMVKKTEEPVIIKPTGITVYPDTLSLLKNEKTQIEYKVFPSDVTDAKVKMVSSDPDVATINYTGVVTAKNPGQCDIYIISQADPTVSTVCKVKVVVPIKGIELDKTNVIINKGDTKVYTLKAKLTPSDTTDTELGWKSSNTKVAKVNSKGQFKAVGEGTCKIRCYSKADSKIYADCTVSVVVPVKSIKITSYPEFLNVGQTAQIKYTVSPSSATIKDVVFRSNDESVVQVSKNGVVKGIKAGTAKVRVESVENSKIYDYFSVAVGVQKITIDSYPKVLFIGETGTIKGTVLPASAKNKKVVFSSSNTGVVQVNEKGNVKGVATGSAVITVSSVENPNVKATCKITVSVKVTKIVLDTVKYTGKLGGSYTIKATVYHKDAVDKSLVWKSNKPEYVSVDSKGNIKFLKETPEGKYVTITCYSAADKTVKATCKVKVN